MTIYLSMKHRLTKFLALGLITATSVFAITSDSFVKESPEVKPFMEEVIRKFPDVRDLAISPDEREIYFTIQSYANELSAIVFVTNIDGTYSKPQMAVFSGRFSDMEPVFSADGLRMYFVSNRPLKDTANAPKDYDIWYVERKTVNDAWSKPVNMGAPVNTGDNEFYPSFAKNGNLYFTCDGRGSKGKDDIFMCQFRNGQYLERETLSDSINSDGYEFNAFVAPDESYLIYTCYNKKGDFGSGDLYISRKQNGVWEKGVNCDSKINTNKMEYCPFVDTKRGVLYFTSRRNKVNTTFDSEQTLDEMLREMNRYENGQSRLYQFYSPGLKVQ